MDKLTDFELDRLHELNTRKEYHNARYQAFHHSVECNRAIALGNKSKARYHARQYERFTNIAEYLADAHYDILSGN